MIKHSLYFIALISVHLFAQPLPNPLTLGVALNLAETQSIAEQQQQILIKLDRINLEEANSAYNPVSYLDFQLGKRKEYADVLDNSHAFARFKQTFYNQDADINSASWQSKLSSNEDKLAQLKQQKIIQVMRAFFDVILADMSLEVELESLAMSAIRANRVQDAFDLEDASEVELLEKQTQTQYDVSKRLKAASQQIITRAKLGQLLGVSYEQRPDDLVRPNLQHYFEKELGEFDAWKKKILENNPTLQTMQRTLNALNQEISAQENNLGLVISGDLRLGEQAYQKDKNGNWRAGLNLSVPFGENDTKNRKISQLTLQAKQQQLEIEAYKIDLIEQALNLWSQLSELGQIQTALNTELNYRDLYLERSRANYEMEIASDIGNAMTELTRSEWKLAKNEFDYVINWETLKLLAGEKHEY